MKSFFVIFILIFTRVLSWACNDSTLIAKFGMKTIYASDLAEYIAQEKDSAFVKQLDSTLQANAERLFTKFNHKIDSRIRIQIFPEFNITTCVCGDDSLKETNALACTHYKKINMASSFSKGMAYENRNPRLVIIHEYAHAITFDIIGEKKMWLLTPWLREGLAIQCEYSPRYKTSAAIVYAKKEIQSNAIPSLKKLCNKYTAIEYPGIWAGWLSEYITYKYGWETMLDLMMNNGDFSKTLKISYKQLDKEWVEFMKNKLTAN